MRTFTICLVAVTFVANTRLRAEDISVDQGYLFIDGVHVTAPYQLHVVDGMLSANGFKLTPGGRTMWTGDFTETGGAEHKEYGRLVSTRYDTRNQHRRRDVAIRNERRSVDLLDLFKTTLEQDGVVVWFDRFGGEYFVNADHKGAFAAAAIDSHKMSVTDALERLGIHTSQAKWIKMFDDYHVPNIDAEKFEEWIERGFAVENMNRNQIAAQARLDNAGYPLTVLGMLIGAIGLGHSLRWSADRGEPNSQEAIGFFKKGLLLIAAMSVLDLTWTILMSQAGQMRETNPIAANLISSPWQLVAFKFLVTAGACGILYSLRSHQAVQKATWWMCIVCILLTFRWVMMSSFV